MFLWVTDREPTQTTEGSKHEACVRCGFVRAADVSIPPLAHVHALVQLLAAAPTCTEAGHEAYVFCTTCYRYYADLTCAVELTREALTLPALGHVFTTYYPNGDATTDSDGTKTATCDREGCTATQTVTDQGSILIPEYTVTFYGFDGVTVWSEQRVSRGEDAVPPILDGSDALNFLGWQGRYTDICADAAVYAIRETRANVFVLSSATTEDGEICLTLSVRGEVLLCGAELRLLYDVAYLSLVQVQVLDASVMAHVSADGVVQLNFVSGSNRTEAFDLLRITLRATEMLTQATTVLVGCDNCIYWLPDGVTPSSSERLTIDGVVWKKSNNA